MGTAATHKPLILAVLVLSQVQICRRPNLGWHSAHCVLRGCLPVSPSATELPRLLTHPSRTAALRVTSPCLPLLQGRIFGETFPLAAAGAGGLSTDALVPGIAVFSRRAEALAAWTSGVELASVSADTDRACLILETGVNERFRCHTCTRSVRYLGVEPFVHVTTAAAS